MIPWTDSIRQSGKLTINMASLAGSWAHVFRQALHDFNRLCTAHRLGVQIIESKRSAEDKDGANISVQTADGGVSASYDNMSKSEDFDGSRLHGMTLLFWRDPERVLEKAYIFLPSQPKVSTPQRLRAAGPGVMKVIAAHELLHACGLENAEHSRDDLFQGNPRVNAGDTAAGDKILIGVGPKEMPELYLGGGTAKNVKDLWTK